METKAIPQIVQIEKRRILPKIIVSPALRSVFSKILNLRELNCYLRYHRELGCLPMSWSDSQGNKVSIATAMDDSHTVIFRTHEFEKFAKKYNFRELNEQTIAESNFVFGN